MFATMWPIRLGFRLGELVAPGAAARRAARMWFAVPARQPPSTLPQPAGATEFAVEIPGGAVCGRTWGDGPTVYFLHGWGGRAHQAHPFVTALVDRGLRVVTFDAPGHGESVPRRRTHAIEFAEAFEAVQRSFGPAHAVVAHSLGTVALMIALRSGRTAPQRIALLAPQARVDGQLDRLAHLLGLGPRTRARLDHEVAATTGSTVGALALAGLPLSFPGAAAVVVHDRTDTFAPYEQTATLVADWPGARLVTTHGLGHIRLLGDSQVVAAVVEAVTGPR